MAVDSLASGQQARERSQEAQQSSDRALPGGYPTVGSADPFGPFPWWEFFPSSSLMPSSHIVQQFPRPPSSVRLNHGSGLFEEVLWAPESCSTLPRHACPSHRTPRPSPDHTPECLPRQQGGCLALGTAATSTKHVHTWPHCGGGARTPLVLRQGWGAGRLATGPRPSASRFRAGV